ncbi:hypothetical protein C8F04DRAFT_1304847 [Mycena alexandri]|uniref:Uncharacterized protein n=1 Tax=Mycena alexandri TaxID=1745969 RepID=A0AAD6SAX7_9AGAR|nr:hypothetical protein C8F04DRAFT_1304847 [Mycena alexandri]
MYGPGLVYTREESEDEKLEKNALSPKSVGSKAHVPAKVDGPKAHRKPQSGPRCLRRANHAEVDERQRVLEVLEVLEFLGRASFFAVGTARFLSSPAKSFRVKFINATALILPDSSYYPVTLCTLSPQTAAFKTQTARTVMIFGKSATFQFEWFWANINQQTSNISSTNLGKPRKTLTKLAVLVEVFPDGVHGGLGQTVTWWQGQKSKEAFWLPHHQFGSVIGETVTSVTPTSHHACSAPHAPPSSNFCRSPVSLRRIDIRSLSTVSQSTPSIQPADKPEKRTRRKRERFAEPYRTNLDIDPFSCDWDSWDDYNFLEVHPEWHDLTMMEFFVKRVAKVPGTIRPLTFVPGVPDPCVAFEAAGKYYYLNTMLDYLDRFGGGFKSHDAFLTAFTRNPPIEGAHHQFPRDTKQLYGAVWKEQDRRAAKTAKAAKTLDSA